jgi:hypothetical protein
MCAEAEIKLHTLIFVMFIPCIVNEIKIRTAPTNAQFYYYVFHYYLALTCFGFSAIIRELTPYN